MGRSQAEGIASSGLSIDRQLEWHLEYNHFPPVNLKMVPACKEAIELVAADEGNTEITVGDDGMELEITAFQIVEDLHLGTWVESQALLIAG